jgi:hypothetical protein
MSEFPEGVENPRHEPSSGPLAGYLPHSARKPHIVADALAAGLPADLGATPLVHAPAETPRNSYPEPPTGHAVLPRYAPVPS